MGAQSVFFWEPGLSVVSLLHGQAVFTESVSGPEFPQFCVSHGGQAFCNGVVSVKGQKASQYTLVFGGLSLSVSLSPCFNAIYLLSINL